MISRRLTLTAAIVLALLPAAGCGGPSAGASEAADQARAAQRMIRGSQQRLAPVYAPLADYLVDHLDLADAEGVGIDVGSGPGTLIVELCRRTRLHWVNADVNPHFFPYFYRLADEAGVAHRVSAMRADVRRLPFRSGWARAVVSRGSFHFWGDRDDRKRGFAEIYRVLAPGGVAYIGRGFSPNLPLETVRRVRARSTRAENERVADQLAGIMEDLGIADYQVHLPTPPDAEGLDDAAHVNYGVWVEFRKPAGGGE